VRLLESFETQEGFMEPYRQDGYETTADDLCWRTIFRGLFYFGCATVVLAVLLVALITASAPPPEDARIVLTDSAGTHIPSRDTIKALRQSCAKERIEAPSWHWTPVHPSEIALRCMVRNRDTGLPSTILWHFSDFGNGQAGQDLVLLTGVEANGQPMDAYAAGYFLISILQSM
jgi:hypothetical protein